METVSLYQTTITDFLIRDLEKRILDHREGVEGSMEGGVGVSKKPLGDIGLKNNKKEPIILKRGGKLAILAVVLPPNYVETTSCLSFIKNILCCYI